LLGREEGRACRGLGDGTVEELFATRAGDRVVVVALVGGELQHHGRAACTRAHDDNVVGIAAKVPNVLLNPFQRCSLITEPIVVVAVLCNLFARQETVDAIAVVHGDYHDALVEFTVHALFTPRFLHHFASIAASWQMETTTGNVYQNGQIIARLRIEWSEDVQAQTVLCRTCLDTQDIWP